MVVVYTSLCICPPCHGGVHPTRVYTPTHPGYTTVPYHTLLCTARSWSGL